MRRLGLPQAGTYLLERSARLAQNHPRSCLITVGEVSVHVDGLSGQGGRSQHLALWCALKLAKNRQPVTIFSDGSDGVDGNSPAAGAVAVSTTVERAHRLGLDPESILESFDSFRLFNALEDTITTGPTGNNLRDLRIFLSDRSG